MNEKSILITGCSSGIGLKAAEMLQVRGYRVFATARKPEDVKKLKTLGFESFLLDVCDSDSIKNAVNQVAQATEGKLYAVFNNAGFVQASAIQDLTRDMIRHQFETLVFGAIEVTQQVLPLMQKQGYGRIIQNSSILGLIAPPFVGAYAASKFALEALSTSLRQELQGTSIYISILNSGPIQSNLRQNSLNLFHREFQREFRSGLYEKSYEKLDQLFFQQKNHAVRFEMKPDAIVKQLIRALETPRPKLRYYVGLSTRVILLLKAVLPEKAMDWCFTHIYNV